MGDNQKDITDAGRRKISVEEAPVYPWRVQKWFDS
jgi:hypothetical protein